MTMRYWYEVTEARATVLAARGYKIRRVETPGWPVKHWVYMLPAEWKSEA